MDNATRRQLLQRHRQSGYTGSILDVYKAYDQGVDLLGQFEQTNNVDVAETPQQFKQGLRPAHQAGDINKSMVFPNVPPNTPFNTVGMKAPINIQKFDEQGHLVKSYENVPPGIQSLPTGPQRGTVIETPAQMQFGGPKPGPRVPEMSDAEMSLKIIQEANAGNPAARRMRSDYGQRMLLPGETDPSTHYMASFDNYAVPTVQEDYIGGPLSYNPNPAPSKADFRFDTPEQAAYFAKNYKQASAAKTFQQKNGGVRKAQNGLPPYYASSKNDPRYIAYNDSLNLNLATLAQDRLMGPGSNKSTDNIDYWTPEQLQDARTPKYHPILGYAIALDYQSQEDQFQDEDGDGKIDYNPTARKEDEQLINYYKSLGFTDDNIMYHSSPDLVHPTIKPSYTYFDGTADSPYYVAPKQEVILSSKLPLIQPKQISTSIQAPELQIPKIPTYLNSTPIYRQDPSVSTSQYQIGENMWDPNKKQWFRSIFDKEMQGAFRQNAKPRKEKWRTIETPPGGFKYGGMRKYQAGNPPLFGIDSELLKVGIAGTESSGGVNMMNPGSTATGLYGQRFSEIKDSYPGTREEFSTNIAAQDSIFDRRLYQGLNDERSMLNHLQHMYERYPEQIAEKGYTAEQLAGIINMLGREGTRQYLGYVVRDKRDLAEVFPDKYGPNVPEDKKNKTPDEYAQTMQWWMDRYAEDNCPGGECMKTTQKRGGKLGIKRYFKLRK
jgi:uncharacterized membrane protein (UPF0127 family)